MERCYFIIKRTPWEYDKLPEYYNTRKLKFTRNLKKITIFNSMDQAIEVMHNIKKSDPEAKNYTFSIHRM